MILADDFAASAIVTSILGGAMLIGLVWEFIRDNRQHRQHYERLRSPQFYDQDLDQ